MVTRGQLKLEKVHFRLPSLDQKRGVTWNVFSAWGCSWRLLSVWEVAILFRASKQFQRSIPFLSLSHWCKHPVMVLFCDVQNNENTQHYMKDICSLNSLRFYNGDKKKIPSPYDWRDQFNKGVIVDKHAQGWKTCHAIRRRINERDLYPDETNKCHIVKSCFTMYELGKFKIKCETTNLATL